MAEQGSCYLKKVWKEHDGAALQNFSMCMLEFQYFWCMIANGLNRLLDLASSYVHDSLLCTEGW